MKLLPCPECSGEMESQMVCERCGHRESLVLSADAQRARELAEMFEQAVPHPDDDRIVGVAVHTIRDIAALLRRLSAGAV